MPGRGDGPNRKTKLPGPTQPDLRHVVPDQVPGASTDVSLGPSGAAQPEGLENFVSSEEGLRVVSAAESAEERALEDQIKAWDQLQEEIEYLRTKKEGDWRSLVKQKIETFEGQISELRATLGSGKSEAYRRSASSEIEKREAWIASLRS